jgi:hypothetical protein
MCGVIVANLSGFALLTSGLAPSLHDQRWRLCVKDPLLAHALLQHLQEHYIGPQSHAISGNQQSTDACNPCPLHTCNLPTADLANCQMLRDRLATLEGADAAVADAIPDVEFQLRPACPTHVELLARPC